MTGSQQDGRIYVRILLVPKKKSWDLYQVRLLHCGILPSSLRVLSLHLVSLAGLPLLASWLPAFFLLFLWCCSESEDSVINLRIQHSNCLWSLFFVVFYLYIEFISCLDALHSVHNSLYLHTLPNEQVPSVKQILFGGVMTPTLLPVRPGLHSTDVGLL